MSADNEIVIQQRKSDGRWVAQHWFASNDGRPDPEQATDTYASMQEAVDMNHDRARETEYGFTIVESEQLFPAVDKLLEDSVEPDFLTRDLRALLNGYSMENASGTPDFILAEYLLGCLRLYDETIKKRSTWRAESVALFPALQRQNAAEVWEPINANDIYTGMYIRATKQNDTYIENTGIVMGKVFIVGNSFLHLGKPSGFRIRKPGWNFEVRKN